MNIILLILKDSEWSFVFTDKLQLPIQVFGENLKSLQLFLYEIQRQKKLEIDFVLIVSLKLISNVYK